MKRFIHRIGFRFITFVLAVSFVYSQGFDRDAAERRRDAVTQQPRLLDIGEVVSGMVVGEVGAGAGYLAFHLAARVGPAGKVYANDILEQAAEVIRSRAAKRGLTNVEAVLGAKDDPQFPIRGLDRVFFLESFHEIRPPDGFLAKLASYLKPTARVVIYELESEKPTLLDGEHRYLRREFLDIVARSPFKIDLIDTNFPGPNPEDHHPVAYVLSLKDRPDPAAKYDYDAIERRRSARFQEHRLLDISGVEPGMIVADIGAGEGYLTFHLAARVGPAGKVYANEILESALDIVRSRAARKGLANVETVLGTDDDPRFPTRDLDRAFFLNSFHEVKNPDRMLANLALYLKPKALVVIYEWESEKPEPGKEDRRYTRQEMLDFIGRSPFKTDRIDTTLPGPFPDGFHPTVYVLLVQGREVPLVDRRAALLRPAGSLFRAAATNRLEILPAGSQARR